LIEEFYDATICNYRAGCNTFITTAQSNGWCNGRTNQIETIAKAGIAVGVDGIFIETHFDPANAKVMVQICCIWIILRP
jgi:3-deoxy-D-manno-octulosonic acid (KDO) 8-phosphate synthase